MRSKAAIAEVPVVSRTVAQQGKRPAASENTDLPHITIADIQPQNVRRFLRLQPDPDPGSCWQLTAQDKIQGPEHLGRYTYPLLDTRRRSNFIPDGSIGPILSGYWRAAGRDGENKALMRSRLEIILVAVLASKKRESASAYGSLHLQFENSLSLPWSYLNGDYVLEGTTDYSIWYGGQKKGDEPATSLCIASREHWTISGIIFYGYVIPSQQENLPIDYDSHTAPCKEESWSQRHHSIWDCY